jgi:hypothetical protein
VAVTGAVLAPVLILGGISVLCLFGEASTELRLVGAGYIGWLALSAGVVGAALLLRKKKLIAVLSMTAGVVLADWIFVLWTLPDFERYKPIRQFCQILRDKPPEALVGYYKFAAPSMTFYLRRPIFEYYDPEELKAVMLSDKDVYCVVAANEYESIDQQVKSRTRVLARLPIFQVKLRIILERTELPQVLLVSNKAE